MSCADGDSHYPRTSGSSGAQILHRRIDQLLRALVGITFAFELHRAVAAVAAGLEDSEGLHDIDAKQLVAVELGILHVAHVVSVLEHSGDGVVVELLVASQHGVAEVGEGVQPGMIGLLDRLDQEKRVFGLDVVVFEVDDHVLLGAVVGYLPQTLGRAVDVGRAAVYSRYVHARWANRARRRHQPTSWRNRRPGRASL